MLFPAYADLNSKSPVNMNPGNRQVIVIKCLLDEPKKATWKELHDKHICSRVWFWSDWLLVVSRCRILNTGPVSLGSNCFTLPFVKHQLTYLPIHNLPLAKSISSNGLILKQYRLFIWCHNMCRTSGFAVLPLCYMLTTFCLQSLYPWMIWSWNNLQITYPQMVRSWNNLQTAYP